MANLKEKGILNELQARFLSNISIEIQNSNYVSLQPSRILREEQAYQIAGQIALQFLKKHGLKNAIQSFEAETQGKISLSSPKDLSVLQYSNKQSIISQLKKDKLKNIEVYQQKYNKSLRESIQKHVNDVINPPKPQPSPKKAIRSILPKSPTLSPKKSSNSEAKSP